MILRRQGSNRFQKQLSRTFPDSDWFFKGSKIHINSYTPEISMLILLTSFYSLYIFWVQQISRTFQGQWPFSRSFQSWKMPEWNSRTFQDFPGLSRFSRTCTNPGRAFSKSSAFVTVSADGMLNCSNAVALSNLLGLGRTMPEWNEQTKWDWLTHFESKEVSQLSDSSADPAEYHSPVKRLRCNKLGI